VAGVPGLHTVPARKRTLEVVLFADEAFSFAAVAQAPHVGTQMQRWSPKKMIPALNGSFEDSGRVEPPRWPLIRWTKVAEKWTARARERRMLSRLSERALKDIGLSVCDAIKECEKPFWRP
jgi:uncharacterized protein YjiS (DUF1127 family)